MGFFLELEQQMKKDLISKPVANLIWEPDEPEVKQVLEGR